MAEKETGVVHEVIHCRYDLKLSLWDIIKYLYGGKIDMSICVKVAFNFDDGKYQGAEFTGYDAKARVWYTDEPDSYDLNKQYEKSLHSEYS